MNSGGWSYMLLCLVTNAALLALPACFTNPAWSDSSSPLAAALGGSEEDEDGSVSDADLYAVLGAARDSGLVPASLDSNPPVPGNGGVFDSAIDITGAGMTLRWSAATDDVTPQAELRYRLYFSTADNISTIADAQLNGSPVGDFAAGITSQSTEGLLESVTQYYFNVIVLDAANNPAAYQTFAESTSEGCGQC